MHTHSLHVVFVDAETATFSVTLELLHAGGGPAPKLRVVCETGVPVIVRVPEVELAPEAIARRAKDRLPLIVACVHAALDSEAAGARVHEILVPSLVRGVVSEPILGALNIEPNLTGPRRVAVTRQVADHRVDLRPRRRRARRTGEHVDVPR